MTPNHSLSRSGLFVLAILLVSGTFLAAQSGGDFEYLPGVSYDPAIPTTESVLGHEWGERVFSPEEITLYLQRLAEASDKVELVRYGETWEGRPLHYLIVSSPDNLARRTAIQQANRALAAGEEASGSTEELPATVWLIYGIHGNEISSPNAALLVAYHLAAAQGNPLVDQILQNCLVLIDPLQNPDGRSRFVHYFEQTRGRWPDPDPQAAEHNETWPGGRTNHYLFDMNRDWFALTQPETRGRVKVYLEWYPQVVVDLHEMGGESTYYFAPPARPVNPLLTEAQRAWWIRFGKNNARWFDRAGIPYFTREVFDAFYPGYGEGWPMFQGSIGMTYEQASARGLVYRRRDGTLLPFSETVRHHFLSSLATLETASSDRSDLLRLYREIRRRNREQGVPGAPAAYVLPPDSHGERTRMLVRNLLDQGIEVDVATAPFKVTGAVSHLTGAPEDREFPAGSYVVRLRQPAATLVDALLSRHVTLEEEFLAEQERLRGKRKPDEFYDVTAWSLPLLYNVACYSVPREPAANLSAAVAEQLQFHSPATGEAGVAYLIPWGSFSTVRLLAALQRAEIRCYSADRAFELEDGRKFPAGTIIVPRNGNTEELPERIRRMAAEAGARVEAVDSGWVAEGINLGSNRVQYLPPPRIAMAYGEPTASSSVGALRYILEQVFEYPVTLIHADSLARARLQDYNVIILPGAWGRGGGYSAVLGARGAERLKTWVQEGGTLVAIGAAAAWLTDEKVGLLASRLVKLEHRTRKSNKQPAAQEAETEKPAGGEAASSEAAPESALLPEEEEPPAVPGAILRGLLDTEHWLAFGFDPEVPVLATSNRIFEPLKLNEGANVGRYAAADRILLSGYLWKELPERLAHQAFLMHQSLGRGHVVAFAEDPGFRAYLVGHQLFLANAVFLGPGH
ncbi:MAG: M14 family zinc carboxypeptidase [Acidobacteriota bacterium]